MFYTFAFPCLPRSPPTSQWYYFRVSEERLQELIDEIFELPPNEHAELLQRLVLAAGDTDFDEMPLDELNRISA